MPTPTLLEHLAHSRGITAEKARRRLVAAAIPGWRRAVMHLLEPLFPGRFQIDWSTITSVGNCRTLAEVEQVVEIFRYRSKGDPSWLRMGLGFRASGRRLLNFAATELNQTSAGPPA